MWGSAILAQIKMQLRFIPLVSTANGRHAHTALNSIFLQCFRPIGINIVVLQKITTIPRKCGKFAFYHGTLDICSKFGRTVPWNVGRVTSTHLSLYLRYVITMLWSVLRDVVINLFYTTSLYYTVQLCQWCSTIIYCVVTSVFAALLGESFHQVG